MRLNFLNCVSKFSLVPSVELSGVSKVGLYNAVKEGFTCDRQSVAEHRTNLWRTVLVIHGILSADG